MTVKTLIEMLKALGYFIDGNENVYLARDYRNSLDEATPICQIQNGCIIFFTKMMTIRFRFEDVDRIYYNRVLGIMLADTDSGRHFYVTVHADCKAQKFVKIFTNTPPILGKEFFDTKLLIR